MSMNTSSQIPENIYQESSEKYTEPRLMVNSSLRPQRSIFTQANVDYSTPYSENRNTTQYSELYPSAIHTASSQLNNEELNSDDGPIDLSHNYMSTNTDESSSVSADNLSIVVVKQEPVSPRNDNTKKRKWVVLLPEKDTEEQQQQQYNTVVSTVNNNILGAEDIKEESVAAQRKQDEVLKAARSLFSKRTRTLCHWLSPHISKAKLKETVATAWDTLPTLEKDFYISQVLSRFGVVAIGIMVNPQIEGFHGVSSLVETHMQQQQQLKKAGKTRQAVDALLQTTSTEDKQDSTGMPPSRQYKKRSYTKRNSKKIRRQSDTTANRNIAVENDQGITNAEVSLEKDFVDDPELCKELEQFKWVLEASNAHEH